MFALIELAGDEDSNMGTEEWINLIDRGGLWHVNDDIYDIFVIMELEALFEKIQEQHRREQEKKTFRGHHRE